MEILLATAGTLKSFQRRFTNLISIGRKQDDTKINGSGPVASAEVNGSGPVTSAEVTGSGPALTSAEPVLPFDIEELEKTLNYKFKNKMLLVQAFTDPSCGKNCVSYERLELIGDSILNLVMTTELFIIYPEETPGTLTKLRAANVDTEKLARASIKHNLHKYLLHNKPMLEEQIVEFVQAIEKDPTSQHSDGLLRASKSLADIVESTIGAVYKDCEFSTDSVSKVIMLLLEPIIPLDKLKKQPMTALNELCHKHQLRLTSKDTWKDSKDYYFFIEDKWVGHGVHHVKKETTRYRAAKNAIDNFPIFFRVLLVIYVFLSNRPLYLNQLE